MSDSVVLREKFYEHFESGKHAGTGTGRKSQICVTGLSHWTAASHHSDPLVRQWLRFLAVDGHGLTMFLLPEF